MHRVLLIQPVLTNMSLINLSATACFTGFNTRYGYLGEHEVSMALRAFFGIPLSDGVIMAAEEAVSGNNTQSVNFQWVETSIEERHEGLRNAPYIGSLMWAHMYTRAGFTNRLDVEEILRFQNLPTFWGASTLNKWITILRRNVQGDTVSFIETLQSRDNLRHIRLIGSSDNLHVLGLRRFNSVAAIAAALQENEAAVPQMRREPRRIEAIVPPAYVFEWVDPEGPPNTVLSVSSCGSVTYKYNGSFWDSGTGDTRAVRRAIRAWRAWEKPEGLKLHCVPARPRLREFYRLFPEVEIL